MFGCSVRQALLTLEASAVVPLRVTRNRTDESGVRCNRELTTLDKIHLTLDNTSLLQKNAITITAAGRISTLMLPSGLKP